MPSARANRRAFLAGLAGVCTAGCLDRRSSTATASPALTPEHVRTSFAGFQGPAANIDEPEDDRADSLPIRPVPAPFVNNPILAASDVTDVDARFVADPFLLVEAGTLHLFFEVLPEDGHGVIGHARSHDGGKRWTYDGVVLDPGYHVSYPMVFQWDGDHYLLPEDGRNPDDVVRLYRADRFPTGWTPVADLVRPAYGGTDHALLRRHDTWWLLVGDDANDRLHAYWSDDLVADGWTPHANNPVVGRSLVRPAGRPVVTDSGVSLFFQDTSVEYGNDVRAVSVETLRRDRYRDEEHGPPVISGTGWQEGIELVDRVSDDLVRRVDDWRPDGWPAWNADRMHHLDPWFVDTDVGWLCAVDGFDGSAWSIGLYVAPP